MARQMSETMFNEKDLLRIIVDQLIYELINIETYLKDPRYDESKRYLVAALVSLRAIKDNS
jgi:hypothetical protein